MDDKETEELCDALTSFNILMRERKHELRVVNIACTNCNGHIPCIEGRSGIFDIIVMDEKTIYPKQAIAVEKQLFCTPLCFDEFMFKMKKVIDDGVK